MHDSLSPFMFLSFFSCSTVLSSLHDDGDEAGAMGGLARSGRCWAVLRRGGVLGRGGRSLACALLR